MTPIVNPFVALVLALAVALLLLATVAMIASRGKKKLYKRITWTLVITLAISIVVRFFLFHLLVDGWYFGPCETGEGVVAGMPCPETPAGGER